MSLGKHLGSRLNGLRPIGWRISATLLRKPGGRAKDDRPNGTQPRMPNSTRPRIGWQIWLLLTVVFLSIAMTMGQITVLGKQVYDMTGSELNLGLLGLVEFLPTLLLVPVSGMVADRYDRRLIYAVGLGGEAVASLGLFLYVASSPTSVMPIFVLVTGYGVARAFLTSASRALPVDLAPEGTVERVVALNAACWQAGLIIGPIAFAFAFVAHIALPYLLAVVVSLTAIGLLMLVPSSTVDRAATVSGLKAAIRDSLEGPRFIRNNPILLGAISLDLFAVLFGGAVALLPAIAEERLGVGPLALGVLRAATGIGGLTTALAVAMWPLRRKVGRTLMVGVGIFGAATIALGLTRSFAIAFIALLVLSSADSISVYIRGTIVPLATPEDMRGRVLAVEYVFIGGSNELGAFESGVAGRFLGIAGAVVTGGLGALVVVAVWWWLFPELRSIDRFSEVRPSNRSAVAT